VLFNHRWRRGHFHATSTPTTASSTATSTATEAGGAGITSTSTATSSSSAARPSSPTAFGYAVTRGPVVHSCTRVAPALGVVSVLFGAWYVLGALEAVPYVF
jgi:hypothetical protein